MPLDPKDPFFEGAVRRMIQTELANSTFAAIVRQLQGGVVPRTYTTTTLPDPTKRTAEIIFVSDAAAGSKFQGSDGSSWVSLG